MTINCDTGQHSQFLQCFYVNTRKLDLTCNQFGEVQQAKQKVPNYETSLHPGTKTSKRLSADMENFSLGCAAALLKIK